MKSRALALCSCALCAALLAGCGGEEPYSSSESAPDSSSAPFSEPAIGGDWRAQRGYSNEIYCPFGEETVISLFSEGAPGYGFYDAEEGWQVATLTLNPDMWSREDMDPDRLWTLDELDLNEDGVMEYGVPMRGELVLWYEYVNDIGFRYYGQGDSTGPDGGFPQRVGAGLTDVYQLSEDLPVRFSYFESEDDCGYLVVNEEGSELIGALSTGWEAGASPMELDRSGDDNFILEDRDGDGIAEIGLPLTDGSILWFRYDAEQEDFVEEAQQVFAMEEEEAFSLLLDALGSEMEGMTLRYDGVDMVNGESCATFSYGAMGQDAFVAERHFAVAPGGAIYEADVIHGMEYLPFEP